jgi:hypothetical protein
VSTITLTLSLTKRQAPKLAGAGSDNFYREQPERFEFDDLDAPHPLDQVFAEGSLHWCAIAADALLLCAYEQACGHTTTLLWDLAAAEQGHDPHVVLSSRPLDRLQGPVAAAG